MSRGWVRPKLAMAPHDAGLASLGGLNHGRRLRMPPSPWVPKLWGPVCILTPTPNIRAPIRLQGGGLLAAGSGGCGVRVEASPQPAGAAGGRGGSCLPCPPLHSQQRPSRRGEGVCSAPGLVGQEAEFQSRFTLCYPVPAPPPRSRLHSRTGGVLPRGKAAEPRLGLQPSCSWGSQALLSLTQNIPEGWALCPPLPRPGILSRGWGDGVLGGLFSGGERHSGFLPRAGLKG